MLGHETDGLSVDCVRVHQNTCTMYVHVHKSGVCGFGLERKLS